MTGLMLNRRASNAAGGFAVAGADVASGRAILVCLRHQNGVWPWRSRTGSDPVEQQTHSGKAVRSKSFTVCRIGASNPRSLDLQLLARNLICRSKTLPGAFPLSDKWQIKNGRVSLQLAQEDLRTVPSRLTSKIICKAKSRSVSGRKRPKASWRRQARPRKRRSQQARRAFQAAFGLSGSDAAFKRRRAACKLTKSNFNRLWSAERPSSALAGDGGALGGKLRDLRGRKKPTTASRTPRTSSITIPRMKTRSSCGWPSVSFSNRTLPHDSCRDPRQHPGPGPRTTFKRAVVIDRWDF